MLGSLIMTAALMGQAPAPRPAAAKPAAKAAARPAAKAAEVDATGPGGGGKMRPGGSEVLAERHARRPSRQRRTGRIREAVQGRSSSACSGAAAVPRPGSRPSRAERGHGEHGRRPAAAEPGRCRARPTRYGGRRTATAGEPAHDAARGGPRMPGGRPFSCARISRRRPRPTIAGRTPGNGTARPRTPRRASSRCGTRHHVRRRPCTARGRPPSSPGRAPGGGRASSSRIGRPCMSPPRDLGHRRLSGPPPGGGIRPSPSSARTAPPRPAPPPAPSSRTDRPRRPRSTSTGRAGGRPSRATESRDKPLAVPGQGAAIGQDLILPGEDVLAAVGTFGIERIVHHGSPRPGTSKALRAAPG